MFESASPDIESNAILPTFVIFASLISKLPVTSKSPPTLTLPETVKFPPELKDMVSAAAADEAVLKLNFVALLEELKSPSDTASIPAATKMASVPVPSSGAWKLITPNLSLAAISVSPVCKVKVNGLSSLVFVFFNVRPLSATWVIVISESSPKVILFASPVILKSLAPWSVGA